MHFCWRDRLTDEVVDDLIIFPGECTYSRVQECTTGRVYVLKFNNSQLRLFYWLQEPKTDKDDVHCRRINQILNSPNTSTQGTFTSLNVFSQSQLSRIFGPNIAATLSSLMQQEANAINIGRPRSGRSMNQENVTEIPIQRDIAPTSSGSQKGIGSTIKTNSVQAKNSGNIKPKMKSVTILDTVSQQQIMDIVDDEEHTGQEEDENTEKTEESQRHSNDNKD
ncbi:hypothetical protein WA026_007183 [Henosepilachna vigintioctopunctata]|uniref:Pru domain-containing protein n=1 Tax=Henosepilachna vigintioctopunctata TaxID=420089 RepID=A0AAW1V2A0_9CUCU